jgi:peptide/nickel transport system substrate-binding protein
MADALVYAASGLPHTLNPYQARYAEEFDAAAMVFDRLFDRRPDGTWSSDVVREATVDGSTVTIALVPGIHWHDGEDLTAADVCFTVAALLDPRNANRAAPWDSTAWYRARLAGCDVVGEQAVIRMAAAYPEPRAYLGFALFPAHAFTDTQALADPRFDTTPIGTGPMRAVLGRNALHLTPFPNPHHAAPLAIEWTAMDPYVAMDRTTRGGPMVMAWVPDVKGSTGACGPPAAMLAALNTARGPFASPAVRRAVDAAIDRHELAELTLDVEDGAPHPTLGFPAGIVLPMTLDVNDSPRRAILLASRSR